MPCNPWKSFKERNSKKAKAAKWLFKKIPKVKPGILFFVLNIILPGIGTILAGLLGGKKSRWFNVGTGFLQLLTAILLIGWIWSIIWGYMIYKRNSGWMGWLPAR